MKIFIGSSSKYVRKDQSGAFIVNPLLKQIIVKLEENQFDVIPWWSSGGIEYGKHFLESLINVFKWCDGGIFIFGTDDTLEGEGARDHTSVTRDNVVFECGMCYATKGENRTFVITHKDENTKLKIPTDLVGYKMLDLKDAEACSEVLNFFQQTSSSSNKLDKVTFYMSTTNTHNIIKRDYQEWKTKGLFIGTESARLWDKIENHPKYAVNISLVENFVESIIDDKKFKPKSIDNIISFGPGNGNTDKVVVDKIYDSNESICYIPVDINPSLAFMAAGLISNNPEVRIPFAIIDDFEKDYEHIHKIIESKIHEIGNANLFLMLGGTFCNLDGIESDFFNKINYWMDENDYFLLDAFIKDNEYDVSIDTLRTPEHLSANADKDNPDYFRFIINGIIKKHLKNRKDENALHSFEKEFIPNLETELHKYLSLTGLTQKEKYRAYSGIDGTSVSVYKFHRDGKSNMGVDVFVAKCYDYRELRNKIDDKFNLIAEQNGFDLTDNEDSGERDKRSRGLFLFKKDMKQ